MKYFGTRNKWDYDIKNKNNEILINYALDIFGDSYILIFEFLRKEEKFYILVLGYYTV